MGEVNIDYRELLKKYINTVIGAEGTDFLNWCYQNQKTYPSYTQEEVDELQKIASEPVSNEPQEKE
jgi:hypothetical protein